MKTQEITPQEALKLLAEAGKPIDGFVFWDYNPNQHVKGCLSGASIHDSSHPFCCSIGLSYNSIYAHCARVIEPLISAEDAKAIRRCFPKAQYVAMDDNGEAYVFSEKPEADNNRTMWLGSEDSYSAIPGFDNYAPDWRESLVNLDEVLSAERIDVESGR